MASQGRPLHPDPSSNAPIGRAAIRVFGPRLRPKKRKSRQPIAALENVPLTPYERITTIVFLLGGKTAYLHGWWAHQVRRGTIHAGSARTLEATKKEAPLALVNPMDGARGHRAYCFRTPGGGLGRPRHPLSDPQHNGQGSQPLRPTHRRSPDRQLRPRVLGQHRVPGHLQRVQDHRHHRPR